MRKIAMLLILACTPVLTGCTPQVNLGPRKETETIWARMGTPGRVVDSRPVRVQVPDGENPDKTTKWKDGGTARVDGMWVIDEPTVEYYRKLDAEKKAAKAKPGE